MANPQIENGYTKIANELLEAIAYKITNATWLKIVIYIIRITYGFQRKETETNYQAIATKTGFKEETIKDALGVMSGKKIVKFRVVSPKRFVISLCKNYDLWEI